MHLLFSYLKDRKTALLCGLVMALSAAFLFYLYDLPADPLIYVFMILFVVALCFAIPDFLLYRRKVLGFRQLLENLPALWEVPDFSGTYPETILKDSLSLLCDTLKETGNAFAAQRQDMLEYYTLWVHQIKTPLAAMRLILQSSSEETGEALLQEIFQVERYVEMVLGYLRLSSLHSDLQLESCRVHDIVKQAVKKFAPQFIYKKLTLSLEDFDAVTVTDEKWLLFAIEQFLSNALKYTNEGGVSIYVEKPEILVIDDTGIGISPEDLPRVFERGFTGFNGRQDKSASGLGLYLAKEILDQLNTPVKISSEKGMGTQVRIFLHREELRRF